MKNPGKKKCETLRAIRQQIADSNGIEYHSHECTFEGKCKGTCPACEAELRYLTEKIRERQAKGLPVDFSLVDKHLTMIEPGAKNNTFSRIASAAAIAAGVSISFSMGSCKSPANEKHGKIAKPGVFQVVGIVPRQVPEGEDDVLIGEVEAPKPGEDEIIELEGDVCMPVEEEKEES